jgi:hypothetical protein
MHPYKVQKKAVAFSKLLFIQIFNLKLAKDGKIVFCLFVKIKKIA